MGKLTSRKVEMSLYNIAVIFPSRGMAFSQTCEELLDNLEGFRYDIFFAHGENIPDCFNKPLERALKGLYSHFWFVEEDMVLPKSTLEYLLAENTPAICCDYPVTKEGKPSVYRDPDNNAIFGGTGCLLVTREFLESYRKPIFRTDIAWDIKESDTFEATPRFVKGDLYGLHDVTFGLQAYGRGIPIKVSKIRCGQRKLTQLGAQATNIGQHNIETWVNLNPEKLKLERVTHKNVRLNDGSLVYMEVGRAIQLQKEGKLTLVPESYVTLIPSPALEVLL